jgi:hypothetical protein
MAGHICCVDPPHRGSAAALYFLQEEREAARKTAMA